MLLQITVARLKEKMPGSILSRAPPPPAKNPYLTSVSPPSSPNSPSLY